MKNKAVNALIEMGMPADIKGFHYIAEAMELMENEDMPRYWGWMTVLYGRLSEMHDDTPSRVERAIRHAIEVAWSRGKMDTINELFGYTVSNGKGKPTNSEFVALIADKIRLDYKRIS